MKDDFNGISGMKLKKQNEMLLQMALLYLSFQLLIKSAAYFLTTNLSATSRKLQADNDVAQGTEIAMIRLN
jgi:hypothetical protein